MLAHDFGKPATTVYAERRGQLRWISPGHESAGAPLAETFLAYNAALNGLPAVHYRRLGWSSARPSLGRFDLIVASDVLYERGQAEAVAEVIADYAAEDADVVVTDAGRGYAAKLGKALALHGFVLAASVTPEAVPASAISTLRFQRLRWAA